MAANAASYELAEQYRAAAIAARDEAVAVILATYAQALRRPPLTAAAVREFAITAAGVTVIAITKQVRMADRYLADFLTFDLAVPVLTIGLDPQRYFTGQQVRLVNAFTTAATKPPLQREGERDDPGPATLSIRKLSESEVMQSGRVALRDAMTTALPDAKLLTAQQYFRDTAVAVRADRVARGLAPGPRPKRPTSTPRLTGWRRMTGDRPCDVCRKLSTDAVHPVSVVLLPGHPRCACVAVPVTSAGDLIKPPTTTEIPEESFA